MKNYYLILGVDSDATQEEIKSAYRIHAKDLHPDYYGQDSGPFLDLQEAYAILSDRARRRAYDKKLLGRHTRTDRKPGHLSAEPLTPDSPASEPLIPAEDPVDLGDMSLSKSFRSFHPSFDEFFERIWRNFGLIKPKVKQLRSLSLEIRIDPVEALRGGQVRLMVPAQLRCPACGGRGGIGFFECWHCVGVGTVQGEYPVLIRFPPGILNNYVIQVPLAQYGIENFYLNVVFRVSDNI